MCTNIVVSMRFENFQLATSSFLVCFLGSQFQQLFTCKTWMKVSQESVETLFRRSGKRLHLCRLYDKFTQSNVFHFIRIGRVL